MPEERELHYLDIYIIWNVRTSECLTRKGKRIHTYRLTIARFVFDSICIISDN